MPSRPIFWGVQFLLSGRFSSKMTSGPRTPPSPVPPVPPLPNLNTLSSSPSDPSLVTLSQRPSLDSPSKVNSASHRYTQSTSVLQHTPPQTTPSQRSFTPVRARSPMPSVPGEKPRWNYSVRRDPRDNDLAPLPRRPSNIHACIITKGLESVWIYFW